MGLFASKEEKEEKKKNKEKEMLEGFDRLYGLGDLDPRDQGNLLDIIRQSNSLGYLDTGNFLSGNEKDFLQQGVWQQKMEVDQRFLLIKQNDRLNKNLEKIIEQNNKIIELLENK